MPDLARRMARLRGSVEPTWSDAQQRAVDLALAREYARQRSASPGARLGLAVAFAVLAAIVAFAPWPGGVLPSRPVETATSRSPLAPPLAPPRAARTPQRLVLGDGSSVTPAPGGEVTWSLVSPSRVTASLGAGRARFDVTHDDDRVFRVESGPVSVTVLGTAFTVERLDERRSAVSVERGRVRVAWSDGGATATRDLGAGESGVFPQEGARSPASVPGPGAEVAEARATRAAPVALPAAAHEPARDEVGDLLLGADVARLSHHPAEACDPLERVARDHASDPRASLAAFTLGRVLLESLDRPGDAAEAFALARRLAAGGELAPDALAREVQARAAAGDAVRARALAEEYAAEYPSGARLRSVRRHGGLE